MNILLVNMSVDRRSGGGTVERALQLHRHFKMEENVDSRLLSTDVALDADSDLRDENNLILRSINDRWYFPIPALHRIASAIRWSDAIILINHWTILNAMVYAVNIFYRRPVLFCPAGALEIFGRSSLVKRLYNFIIGNRILNGSKAVIAIPKAEAELFATLGVASDRIHVIPNGVNEEDYQCQEVDSYLNRHGLDKTPHILFVGRLNRIKGPDLLIEAFISLADKFTEWKLILFGPDEGLQAELVDRIEQAGLKDRVKLPGFVGGTEKVQAYHAATLLAVTSRMEAMSIVALEAGICGTPVLMTDVCGFNEMAEAGAAVEVEVSTDAIQRALEDLMADRGCLDNMGKKALDFIRENYTWRMSARQHVQICQRLVSAR